MGDLVRVLVYRFTQNEPIAEVDQQLAAQIGFQIQEKDGLVVLMERPEQKRGGGVYIFRPEAFRNDQVVPVILQAPHIRYDRHTGKIAARVFRKTPAVALFLNSAHRYASADPTVETAKSDVAHNADAFYHAATVAVCDLLVQAIVVQFHGFALKNYPAFSDSTAMVLSDGRGLPDKSARFLALADRLRAVAAPDQVLVYGIDTIGQLGGTSNVQGDYILARTDDEFVHVELSDRFRERLLGDKSLLDRFAEAFVWKTTTAQATGTQPTPVLVDE